LCIFAIVIDQAAKFSVLAFLPRGGCIGIFQGMNLVLTFNFGTSFGLLSPQTMIGFYAIVACVTVCIIFLIIIFVKVQNVTEKVLCALTIGGAIGNLLDRFIHGAVVDFIDIYYEHWHWPAFNIADSFISISITSLIMLNLFANKKGHR
jgi:signal peptidase II